MNASTSKYRFLLIHAFSFPPGSQLSHRPFEGPKESRLPNYEQVKHVLDGIDWEQAKADLAADVWDNGRSADALRRSFEQSQHVALARDGDQVVGMARLLSSGASEPRELTQ